MINDMFMILPENLIPDNDAAPPWLNKADHAWQLTAATMVGLQSVPGLVILYGSMVKKKWAVNSAFMALYAFAAVLLCWVLWAHSMAFGPRLLPVMGKPQTSLAQHQLLRMNQIGYIPAADNVYFQFAFAAITVILLAGSLLGRMNFYAWMWFVPMWLTCCYTIGAFSIWGGGFLDQVGGIRTIDYAGGFVIHLSSGVAGFTAAYWVGPRHSHDRQHSPPNNIIHMLGGAGFLWLGWTGFNGGSPYAVGRTASLGILNTHICTASSLLIWVSLDMIFYQKSSVIGAVQGMITGLVCITPGAGLVEPWAAALMGALSGSIPWYTMMVLHRRYAFFQKVDDTLAVFHTHAVAGLLGGILSGLLAKPGLLEMMYGPNKYNPGLLYSILDHRTRDGLRQLGYQLLGALFITAWNVIFTSLICILISRIIDLRMAEDDLEVGDDAAHGEEAYALWGDGERMPTPSPWRLQAPPRIPFLCHRLITHNWKPQRSEIDIATINSSAFTVVHLNFQQQLLRRHKVTLGLSFDRRRRIRASSGNPPVSGTRAVPDETVLRSPVKNLELKKKAMDISADLKGTSIFLVGMKSHVKELIGKLLAELLRYYYFDSDGLVEEAAGGEASAKLYRETDEKGFLESETEVLKQLSSMGRLVVCAGDGAVQSLTNLALLRHGISIWVDIPIDTVLNGLIKDRSASQSPLSLSDSENRLMTQLAAIYEEMRGGYATADATISLQKVASNHGYNDISEVTAEDMTMEVLMEMGRLIRARKMVEEAGRPF